jgi:glyoxylase I family protein
MRIQGFHHLAIQVQDLERALSFYRDLLGLEEQARHQRPDGTLRSIWLCMPDGTFLALEACEGAAEPSGFRSPRPGLHLLSLRIDRGARAEVEAALLAGGAAIVYRTRYTLYLRDPEGNRVGLSHHPHEAG